MTQSTHDNFSPLAPFSRTLRAAGIVHFAASAEAKHPDRGPRLRGPDGTNKSRWAPEFFLPDGKPTADQMDAMFRGADVRRIFIPTGGRSRPLNIICLDFDDPAIFRPWTGEIHARLGERLYIERSQSSGGRHVIFLLPEGVRSCVPARTVADTEHPKGKVRIEVRGDGAGFICAPSCGYERVQGDLTALPMLTMAEYETLIAAAATFNAFEPPLRTRRTVPVRPPRFVPPRRSAEGGDRPGDRYNREHGQWEVLDLLGRHGWMVVGEAGDIVSVLRPGGDSTHTSSGSVDDRGTLIVFSTSTVFEASASGDPRPYSPFDVFALLEHEGDYAAAARALAKQGYGTYPPDPLAPRIIGLHSGPHLAPIIVPHADQAITRPEVN